MRARVYLRGILSLVAVVWMAVPATADVKLPGVFGDAMVLQRDVPIPVWGWADAGEKVTVRLGDQEKTVTADDKGDWSIKLAPITAGGPYALNVRGKNTIELTDVLVGEVWLCSGQSNMAMTVNRAMNFDQEAAAANLPKIRMMTVNRKVAVTPQQDCQGTWTVCNSKTVGAFSATAYFFGRELHKQLGVPVGLINSSWGGTPVQSWTCLKCQQREPSLAPVLKQWEDRIAKWDPEKARANYESALTRWQKAVKAAKEAGRKTPRRPRAPIDPRLDPHRPANLYNGMIAPLAPYAIRGAIWYQGESNANRYQANLYGLQLETQIKNWRRVWGQGDFPYLWVQLPNFHALQKEPVEPSGWVTIQEQMLKTLKVPNTGMAITIDVGEANNIHPKNKQAVGKRLANWALAKTYQRNLVPSGPLFKSMERQGNKIVIRFDHVGDGLAARGGALEGFAIAGDDKKFVWADAVIDGETVVVTSSEVPAPVAVRYAWASNPKCNLDNKAGLPASPFRTDNWPVE